MSDRRVEATVGKGGVILLDGEPFAEGTRVEIREVEEKPKMTQEEWVAHLRKHQGAFAHIDWSYLDEPQYPEPIKPLFPPEDESKR